MITIFDLETTGLSGAYCDVIQFSYIQLEDNGKFVKSDCMYFYHEGMHWDESLVDNVHHISLDFLRQHADDFRMNLVKMYTVLSKADVVGHNAIGFDCPFASQWLARMGLPGLAFASIHDTMKMFRPLTKTARIKLGKLCDMCGFTPEIINKNESLMFSGATHAHNANYDATATALLTVKAIKDGYVNFGAEPVAVKRDTSKHKVCDGIYVKTTYGSYLVDSDGVRSVLSVVPELTLPVTLKAVNAITFQEINGENSITLDTAYGSLLLHAMGADMKASELTLPVERFKEMLTRMF